MMKTVGIRILSLLLVCVLALSLAGCDNTPQEADPSPAPETSPREEPGGASEQPPADMDYVSTTALAASIRDKYADQEDKDFQPANFDVPADQEFFVDLEFNPLTDTDLEAFTQILAVYSDPELTQTVSANWELLTHEDDPTIPQGHTRVYVRPGKYPPGRVWGSYSDAVTQEEIDLTGEEAYYLHQREEGATWGALPRFYLALHLDTATGEPLEKPIVTIFTLESALAAPQSEFYVTQDGLGAFRWNTVPGADYYLIVKREADEGGFDVLWPIARVEGNSWEHPWVNGSASMNMLFYTFGTTEDDKLGWEQAGITDDYSYEGRNEVFTVIAVNGETHSPMGNLHKGTEIAKQLPHTLAWAQNRADAQEGNQKYIPSIGLLPMQKAITTAAGTTVYRRVIYDFDSAKVVDDEYMEYDEGPGGEIQNPRFITSTNLYIPYVLEGTLFKDKMVVEGVDRETYQEQLDTVRRQHEEAAPRGGANRIGISDRDSGAPTAENLPTDIPDKSAELVFANSALSEYLAINMLAANEMIDLSEFPESADTEYLFDAWMEAVYQNPLILGVEGAGVVPGTPYMVVRYSEPQGDILRKQGEIQARVQEIVAQVITPEMTDLEKELALNQYLCDNGEYDFDALENAAANNYQGTDPAYNDSFTPYGILVNNVGVCASYAGAFKLLADQAGLEAIVVTGYMESSLPHAWNRVNIDGQWRTVDVTNNDNEYLFNALLNLPDNAAGKVLVEDDIWMMDKYLSAYTNDDDQMEYYNVSEKRFDKSAIAKELADSIKQEGMVTLRTDYDLSDDDFNAIAAEVMVLLGTPELYGFHWMGVITMADRVPA